MREVGGITMNRIKEYLTNEIMIINLTAQERRQRRTINKLRRKIEKEMMENQKLEKKLAQLKVRLWKMQ